ncbi:MAG: pyridoxal phosphate-dependent aminotransferase [Mogibacterium sp.]|nr:pyridoxal phosphate-dependent aminotransferase [Mogibacterium sp.]
MKYTDSFFDEPIDRIGSGSLKWDNCHARFGLAPEEELLPMWIADMDFRSPVEVTEAIVKRAEAGVYGYTNKPASTLEAVQNWISRRYHWIIEKDWIVSTPGVIPGLHISVQTFSEPGDGVIVQTPVYYPFMEAATVTGRKLAINRLIACDGGDYRIDFQDLEAKVKDPANKVMIFCNPHNPIGKAWSPEDVREVGRLCRENGVLLVSDELHADLMMGGKTHSALCAVSGEAKSCSITYYSPSKTFNLAGLQTAFAIIPNPEIRKRFLAGRDANRIIHFNWFSAAAVESAYTKCDDYVEALCKYIDANMDYMKKFIDERLPMLRMRKSDGTYMVWVDFRGTGMTTEEIEHFIIHKAHIAPDMGSWFGPGGEGFLRFNLACPRSYVEKAMRQLEEALR